MAQRLIQRLLLAAFSNPESATEDKIIDDYVIPRGVSSRSIIRAESYADS